MNDLIKMRILHVIGMLPLLIMLFIPVSQVTVNLFWIYGMLACAVFWFAILNHPRLKHYSAYLREMDKKYRYEDTKVIEEPDHKIKVNLQEPKDDGGFYCNWCGNMKPIEERRQKTDDTGFVTWIGCVDCANA